MQAALILCLAAAASAQTFYTTPLHGYHHSPYYSTFYNGLHGFPHGHTQLSAGGVSLSTIHKREAEAEPEAYWAYQPYSHMAYSHPVHHTAYTHKVVSPVAYTPYMYHHAHAGVKGVSPAGSFSNDAVSHHNYAAKGQYVAKSAGTVHIAKREAEAYYPYASFYSHPVHHNAYTYGHHMAAPIVPVSYAAMPVVHHQVKTYSNDKLSPVNYAGKGSYHAETAGSVHSA